MLWFLHKLIQEVHLRKFWKFRILSTLTGIQVFLLIATWENFHTSNKIQVGRFVKLFGFWDLVALENLEIFHHFEKVSSVVQLSSACKVLISCPNFITLQKFHHVVKLHHLWHVQYFKDVCKLATLWVPMAAYGCPLRVQQVSGIKLCNCLAILKQQEQNVLWEELSEENAVVKQKETNAWRKKRNINALCVGEINASKRQAFA